MRGRLEDAEGFFDSDGVRIWYRVDGAARAGMPLLLVHGGPGATARPFERSIGPLLSLHRPVVYFDYRGCGRSERLDNPELYSADHVVGDIEALRLHLGIRRWAIFGHSLGAAIALAYVSRVAERVPALLFCAPLIRGDATFEISLLQKIARAPADLRVEARRVYQSDLSTVEKLDALGTLIGQPIRYSWQFYDPATSAIMEQIQDDLVKEIGRGLMERALWEGLYRTGMWRFNGYDLLSYVTMPLAVLVSPWDSEVSSEDALRFAASARDGTVILFRRSGHHPYLEETSFCAEQIEGFLSVIAD